MTTNNSWNSQDPVNVPLGGFGVSSLTAHNTILGNGTSAVNTVGPGTAGQVLVGSTSANPTYITPTAVAPIAVTTNASTLSYALTSNPSVSQGGTGDSSFTAYSVLCGGTTSTGALQNVSGLGSSTQILTSNGSAALPTWQTAPSPTKHDWVLLHTNTPGSGTTNSDFTSILSSSYFVYMVIFTNVTCATNAAQLNMTFSTNNGSTYLTTGYQCGLNSTPYNGTTLTNLNSTSTAILSSGLSNSSGFYQGSLYLFGLESAVNPIGYGYFLGLNSSSVVTQGYYSILNTTTTAVNALRFNWSSGNFGSGSIISIYGLNK